MIKVPVLYKKQALFVIRKGDYHVEISTITIKNQQQNQCKKIYKEN